MEKFFTHRLQSVVNALTSGIADLICSLQLRLLQTIYWVAVFCSDLNRLSRLISVGKVSKTKNLSTETASIQLRCSYECK